MPSPTTTIRRPSAVSFDFSGGRGDSSVVDVLPNSLTTPLAYGNRNIKNASKRSWSVSSEESPPSSSSSVTSWSSHYNHKRFSSLPFKKRRFFLLIAAEELDEQDQEHRSPADKGGLVAVTTKDDKNNYSNCKGILPSGKILSPFTVPSGMGSGISNLGPETRLGEPPDLVFGPNSISPVAKQKPIVSSILGHQKDNCNSGCEPECPLAWIGREETPSSEETEGSKKDPSESLPTRRASPVAMVASILSQPMQTRRRRPNASDDNKNCIVINNTNRKPPKRPCHPRLESPLPNGCHGRTSRTQSFCRRGPNFLGSNYCKLHYFDPRYRELVASGVAEESDPSTAKAKAPSDENSSKNSNNGATTIPSSRPVKSHKNTNNSGCNSNDVSPRRKPPTRSDKRPRDKLYRGSSPSSSHPEVRCLAISTRGKRCCYASVASNGNRYCHRHSAFSGEIAGEEGSSATGPLATQDPSKVVSHEVSLSKPPAAISVPQHQEQENKTPSRSTLPQDNPPAVALPPPIALGALSTDRWHNQRVVVAKGPYQSRIGNVVQWRNGWVTVELVLQEGRGNNGKYNDDNIEQDDSAKPDKVYHNRRSYELFLA